MRLRYLTAGESHGRALVGILEGLPSGLSIEVASIHADLKRRKLGYGRGSRQKMEDDSVQILSGIRQGYTLGSPVALMIENKDWKNWTGIMQPEPLSTSAEPPVPQRKLEVPRPGHADYLGGIKYRHDDMRNVLERASARETTIRVALGNLARRFLEELNIQIVSRVVQIGPIEDTAVVPAAQLPNLNKIVDLHQLRVYTKSVDIEMITLMDEAKRRGETLGGIFEVIALNLPLGLGSYVHWDRRLEGDIAQAFMSLNAIKGVEIGLGFELGKIFGSEAHDEYFPSKQHARVTQTTNRSGGIDGGMTTGQPLVVRSAMKPLATLMTPLNSVKVSTDQIEKAHVERSDVSAVPAAAVIGESLLALVLANAILDKFGGDSLPEIKARVLAWNQSP
ncbi:MAG: chorismate synthase [Bdellovibrionales bacterium]|nr:chorismate synthase [Bdellovibrionales bacterium]